MASAYVVADPAVRFHRSQRLIRRGDRAADVDTAAGILDDDDVEAFVPGIFCRITNTEIERETRDEDAVEPAFPQVSGKTCVGFASSRELARKTTKACQLNAS